MNLIARRLAKCGGSKDPRARTFMTSPQLRQERITYNLGSPDLCGAAFVSVVATSSTRLWLPMTARLPRPAGAGVSRLVSLQH
jgi:hypothetical protein